MTDLTGYTIGQELFRGNSTVVYHGTRDCDQLPVIIKTLLPGCASPRSIGRLRHEYDIGRDLDPTCIVRPLMFETSAGLPVLVFEDIGGTSLRNLIPSSGLELERFLNIAIQIAAALEKLHACGIIHKDIKPSNIIVNPVSGDVRLTDLGISSRLQREFHTSLAADGVEGTPSHMSPEQTGRMNRAVDNRTDLYSCGISFFEALTGQPPFRASDPLEWAHCHIARNPPLPHRLNPGVPAAVSRIILKLLAKTPEERYQSARGLRSDLERCLSQLTATGTIIDLEPGLYDRTSQFQISQRLYGREREIRALLESFERVRGGTVELMLVTGHSGVGKTSIVRELIKPVVRHRGYFISGKFEPLQRDIPYACLIQAFRDLVRQILTESDTSIAAWRCALLAALGENGRLITDVIPEVQLIIGEQPEPQSLPLTESQNRFNQVFQDFVAVFARQEHPLVIFTDDLQWADHASLKLIERLLGNSTYLLLVGAFRDSEVDGSHPLSHTISTVKSQGTAVGQISLPALTPEHIAEMVTDTLGVGADEARQLAGVLFEKSGGTPLFVTELFRTLYDEGLIEFDTESASWKWDRERAAGIRAADDMVSLISDKVRSLPEQSQEVLSLAACIGSRFDLHTLAAVYEKGLAGTSAALLHSVSEGLISTDGNFRPEAPEAEQENASFSFIHDRIQQAAYHLIDGDAREITHLGIGRIMLTRMTPEESDEALFEIVNQLNHGIRRISTVDERETLARLNLKAGRKAMASTAYESALSYLNHGTSLLAADAWQTAYDLASDLAVRTLECELLCSRFDQAEQQFDRIMRHLRTPREKAAVCIIRIALCTNLGRFREAVEVGIEGLRMFGVIVPPRPGMPSLLKEYLTSRWLRRRHCGKHLAGILNVAVLPSMTDPDKLVVMELLENLGAPSYLCDKNMCVLLTIRMVNLSLEYGIADSSAFAFALYGMIVVGAFGEFEAGFAFGELAMKLNRRTTSIILKGKTPFVYYNFVHHSHRHIAESTAGLKENFRRCLSGADLVYAGYSLVAYIAQLAVKGTPLAELISEGGNALDFLLKAKNEEAIQHVRIVQQMARCLRGETAAPRSFSGDGFDEDALLSAAQGRQSNVLLQWYFQFKSQALFILGDFSGALEMSRQSEELIEVALGQPYQNDHYLYYSLALAAVWQGAPTHEKASIRKKLKSNLNRLKKWAKFSPENYRHTYLLVAAETSRLFEADKREALRLYEQSQQEAYEQGFIHHAAIACERAAELHCSQGLETSGQRYLFLAHRNYLAWGASAKAKQLEAACPECFRETVPFPAATDTQTTSGSSASDALDMMSVIKVSQAISGEMFLDRLLKRLTSITMENAGAGHGVLILESEGKLFVEARGSTEEGGAVKVTRLEVDGSGAVPESLINYVARTHEPVLLDNAAASGMFMNDPYISEHSTRSVLCTPVINHGRLAGILYLENNLATGAFTRERFRILELLSAQIAISIENARLYEGLRTASEEIDRHNQALEQKVEERTRELKEEIEVRKKAEEAAEIANRAKSEFLNTVSHELRTPLTSVLGYSKIIRRKLEEDIFPIVPDNERATTRTIRQIRDNLGIIWEEGSRLTSLINDFLDLAKLEAGKMTWEMQRLSVPAIIERAVSATAALFEQKQLQLDLRVNGQLPEVIGDRDRLIQVLINLISNAWKFTDHGGITITADHAAGTPYDSIVIGVSDTGIGISSDEQPRVFDKFKQVGDTLTDKPKGTGLGLSICKEIVEYHGGHIWVESHPGSGSTFSFTLPAGSPQGDVIERTFNRDLFMEQLRKRVDTVLPTGEPRQKMVMVVDDDDSIRGMLRQELEGCGYGIIEAANGSEALDKLKTTRPDLILLDVMMPGINGFDVAAIIKSNPITMDVPIIILSVLEDTERGFRLGIDQYLTKPVDMERLLKETGLLISQGASRKRIMVVDESASAIASMAEMLEARGFTVTALSEGSDCPEQVVLDKPDMIIVSSASSGQKDILKSLRLTNGLEQVVIVTLGETAPSVTRSNEACSHSPSRTCSDS